jgi:hypothetical protein
MVLFRLSQVAGFYEQGNKPLGFLKDEESSILKKDASVKRLLYLYSSLYPTRCQFAYLDI